MPVTVGVHTSVSLNTNNTTTQNLPNFYTVDILFVNHHDLVRSKWPASEYGQRDYYGDDDCSMVGLHTSVYC